MNSQRAFWISGAATLAVMLLLGLATCECILIFVFMYQTEQMDAI